MKAPAKYSRLRLGWWLQVPCCVLIAAIAGCRGDPLGIGKTVPVVGQVLVDGKPLNLGSGVIGKVWFHPDAAKGNQGPQVPFGPIDADGTYTLSTRGQAGAPTGWYKVMVVVNEQIDPDHPSKRHKSFCNQKYAAPETSGLAVEVVSQPPSGAYDLRLTH